jgi:hypothetical protein
VRGDARCCERSEGLLSRHSCEGALLSAIIRFGWRKRSCGIKVSCSQALGFCSQALGHPSFERVAKPLDTHRSSASQALTSQASGHPSFEHAARPLDVAKPLDTIVRARAKPLESQAFGHPTFERAARPLDSAADGPSSCSHRPILDAQFSCSYSSWSIWASLRIDACVPRAVS